VGAKVADRIVRELRDKIGGLDLMPERVIAASSNGHAIGGSLVDDAVSALINLGSVAAAMEGAKDPASNIARLAIAVDDPLANSQHDQRYGAWVVLARRPDSAQSSPTSLRTSP
jgi:hypothetical protein